MASIRASHSVGNESRGRLLWLGDGWRARDSAGSGWARGYAFLEDGSCIEDDEIVDYLLRHGSQLKMAVSAMNGCFAAAVEASSGACLITDRYGTIPIYVYRTAEGVHASDEAWQVIEALSSPPVLSATSALDLLRAGYVTGTATLIEEVETVGPASIATIRSDGLHTKRYWQYGYCPELMTWRDAEDRLEHTLRRVAARTIRRIESRGYRAALTLSGGLDSRVLACILSASARDPLLAFSYGTRGDPEIEIAQRVASRLGMPHCEALITSGYLNDDFIDLSVREVGLTTRFTCGIGARHLDADRADIFIPGHTGDFISGGHLPARTGMVRTRDQLRRYLEVTHFRYGGSEAALRRILRVDYPSHKWTTLESSTQDFDMSHDVLGLIDRWNVENRQRRLILMELRAYEALGLWMLPFYDNELVDFFAVIPHDFRIAQNLYIQTAKERLFRDDNNGDLSGLKRIGTGPMAIDARLSRRIRQLRRLQPWSGWALQFGFAELRDLARSIRPKPAQHFGTDPIKSWFRNDERSRNYILERVESMHLDIFDPMALRALLLDRTGEERIYNRLLPSALTIQACVDRARDVWIRRRDPMLSSRRSG